VQVISLDRHGLNFDEKSFGVLFDDSRDELEVPRVAKSTWHRADVGFEHEVQGMVLGEWPGVSSDALLSKVASV
jgi:hypothetical protein